MDDLPLQLESEARLRAKVNGATVGSRRGLDLIEGTGIDLTGVDNPVAATDESVEVTIGVDTSEVTATLAGHGLDANGGALDVDETELVNFTQANLTSGLRLHHVATSEPTLATGDLWYDTDDNLLYVENSSGHTVCITPVSAEVATSEGTMSTSFTDLATVGPAVSVLTGTKAIVSCGGLLQASTGSNVRMGVAVSGATTLAAQNVILHQVAAANIMIGSGQIVLTGLTAGVNTFTVKYLASAGTGTFSGRQITVVGVP